MDFHDSVNSRMHWLRNRSTSLQSIYFVGDKQYYLKALFQMAHGYLEHALTQMHL